MPFYRQLLLFLSFHRRILIGSVLLIGVTIFLIYGLPYFSKNSRQSDSEVRANSGDLSGRDVQRGASDEASSLTNVDVSDAANEEFLFQELNRLQAKFLEDLTPSIKLLTAVENTKVARRLLDLDLDQDRRKITYFALADAILIGMITSLESGYPIERQEDELLRTADEMKADSDSLVQYKGAWLMVAYRMTSFHLEPSDERFQLAIEAIDSEFANVSIMPRSIENFCQLILTIRNSEQVNEQSEELLKKLMERLVSDSSPQVREIGERFRAAIHFKLPDLKEIQATTTSGGTVSEEQVDKLFEGLSEYPKAPLSVFQLALDCVRAEIAVGNKPRASELILRFKDQVISQVSNEELKQAINKAVGELEALLD